ncbi:acyl-ACP--UDP-N-acetylglucosamine O-acyltransferase [Corallincola luteus]|uniref:Acyl-[acyl-carrier-protein]--UDP-N-acetylglucosamine O-acyltransferase n=1 Tax=Corallincola luteus TaxID=1775177 RepID=A0ABY2AN14_9GAMM|nr:acyl-ACP--UDP-N-acetylglucosamine O-acyltransferase [Corallincola luteus]TCI03018.1 acyl-ACP--UDP-N-acetylglucosamine O-acyltransferase [Corallincola luteus]
MIDASANIHPTALVESGAVIGANVEVGPFTYIAANVTVGEGSWIGSHVVIKGPTRIGARNKIFQFASVGEDCQDKKYAGEPTELVMGDDNVVRECVTIHRGTVQDKGVTRIANRCLFMAYVHIGHDCVVGDDVILANNVTLAGHVQIGNHAIVGGLSAFHQFVKVGDHAFIAGASAVHKDVPTYVMARGDNAHGINVEGLKRRGFSKEAITLIRRAYKVIYRQNLTLEEAKPKLFEMADECAEISPLAEFVMGSERGIVR